MTPYHYTFNNPIKHTDPDGKFPLPVIGFIVGAGVDYGFQVAGNFMSGKTGAEAFTDVDFKSVAISGLAGAASGGLSAIGGKGTQLAISTAIDVGESVAKQHSASGTVTVTQTASDVVANKVGGAVASKLDGALGIKFAERQLNRAERVSAGDPSSSGRAKAVADAKSTLDTKNAIKQVAGGAAANIVQNTSNAAKGAEQLIILRIRTHSFLHRTKPNIGL